MLLHDLQTFTLFECTDTHQEQCACRGPSSLTSLRVTDRVAGASHAMALQSATLLPVVAATHVEAATR